MHTALPNFQIAPIKKFENVLAIFVFVFKLNGGLNDIICSFLFRFILLCWCCCYLCRGVYRWVCLYPEFWDAFWWGGSASWNIFYYKIEWITVILQIVGFGRWQLLDSLSLCVCIKLCSFVFHKAYRFCHVN